MFVIVMCLSVLMVEGMTVVLNVMLAIIECDEPTPCPVQAICMYGGEVMFLL